MLACYPTEYVGGTSPFRGLRPHLLTREEKTLVKAPLKIDI